jgi:hypothetical protein
MCGLFTCHQKEVNRVWFTGNDLSNNEVHYLHKVKTVVLITSIDKCSQTQLLIFVLLRGVST